jgi:glyoxylase-like metal-dependent hydrolase (beta-lactamase superfamily II)
MFTSIVFELISKFKGKTILSTHQINENIYAVQCGYVNFYIYQKNGCYVCFDAGFNTKLIYKELNKLNIDPLNISQIFLTHSDYDHYNGIKVFTNSKVNISNKEIDMINKGIHRPFGLNKKLKEIKQMNILYDEEIIEIEDINIKCILTPGHTYGSMSYLVDKKYLFLGDACNIQNNEIKPLQKYINMNQNMHNESINKIINIKNVSMFLVGHSGYRIVSD